MTRRFILNLIGLSPLVFVSATNPTENDLIKNMIKRWKGSQNYVLAIFNSMPVQQLEFSPSAEQMTFAQHFINVCFFNNAYLGILMDPVEHADFDSMLNASFIIERPDNIQIFQHSYLNKRPEIANKKIVADYISETYEFVISNLSKLNDTDLTKGLGKQKPQFLAGHTNLDLILRGESHTSHHMGQAIAYLRMNKITPPSYGQYNVYE